MAITFTQWKSDSKTENFLSRQKEFQKKCEQLLGKTAGAIVVMDVTDGRILTIVNRKEAYGRAYPPGSIFKMLTAVVALEENVTNLNRKVNCEGGDFQLDGYTLHCPMLDNFGDMDMINAIAQSCNKYFYTIGNDLTYHQLMRYCREFGLGRQTHIDLPGEIGGRLPPPLSKRNFLEFTIGNYPDLQTTPLQMAVITSAVANGGKLYQPRFLNSETELKRYEPTIRKMLSYSNSLRIIREGMRLSVDDGTGKLATLNNVTIAGKTGTATAVDAGGLTHSWFVGFAPYETPKIAVVVFHREGYGSLTSAPLAGNVFEAYFSLFGSR